MTPTPAQRPALSAKTAQTINWESVDQEIEAAGIVIYKDAGSASDLPDDYQQRVNRVFKTFEKQCQMAIGPLKTKVTVVLWIVLPLLAFALGAGMVVVVLKNIWGGGAISLASLGGIFAAISKGWILGKDQAMLEILPGSYRAQFELCQTPDQFQLVFNAFLQEMQEMRKQLRGGASPAQQ